jgi:predicted RNA-binding Zn-ribbon protein involved in translation (DUF1610 family)
MPVPKPLPEGLLQAVRETPHMTAFLERMGVPSSKVERKRMRELLKRRGIDTSHWCHSPTRWYTDEELKVAVASSRSYAGVLRALGIPQAGGSQAYLARRIRAAGFDTAHFVGQAHRRGTRAPRRPPTEVLAVLPPGSPRPKATALRAAMIAKGVTEVCALCGSDGTWLGSPLRLVIDHISGDWLDNRLENVRFLCPNCHAQTSTWCRRRTTQRQLPSGTEGP